MTAQKARHVAASTLDRIGVMPERLGKSNYCFVKIRGPVITDLHRNDDVHRMNEET